MGAQIFKPQNYLLSFSPSRNLYCATIGGEMFTFSSLRIKNLIQWIRMLKDAKGTRLVVGFFKLYFAHFARNVVCDAGTLCYLMLHVFIRCYQISGKK